VDAVLAERIRRVQDLGQGGDRAYGPPRATAELNDGKPAGQRVNRKRVARVMREYKRAGIRLRLSPTRAPRPPTPGRRWPAPAASPA
jgi:hypothetical protein